MNHGISYVLYMVNEFTEFQFKTMLLCSSLMVNLCNISVLAFTAEHFSTNCDSIFVFTTVNNRLHLHAYISTVAHVARKSTT